MTDITRSQIVNIFRGQSSIVYDYDDMWQDAQIAAWEAENKYDAGKGVRLGAYALMLAKYRILDSMREIHSLSRLHRKEMKSIGKRLERIPLHEVEEDEMPYVDDSAYHRILDAERRALLIRKSRILSPEQRRAILLYLFSDRSMTDIADMTERSVSNTSLLIRQASKTLSRMVN